MSKLHIALVGGQPYPVFNGILEDQPDKTILICSEDSEIQAKTISREIRQRMPVEIETDIFSPVDLEKIHQKLCNLAHRLSPDDTITVNLSGGTKPWSILFYGQFCNKENTRCIFIDQNNLLWDFKTRKSTPLKHALTLDETFGLNNIKVNKTELSEYTQEDHAMLNVIRKLREVNQDAFKNITQYLSEHQDQLGYPSNGCKISWDKSKKGYQYFFVTKKGKIHQGDLISPHIRKLLLNTGWFEYEVAEFISQWKHAHQLWLNCELTRLGTTNHKTINEIDIIVDTGVKMLFVECKTQVYDATDIDKFNNAVKSYGGIASKRIMVTDVPMKSTAAEKCDQASIMYFALSELKSDEKKKENFFKFLDKEIGGINK